MKKELKIGEYYLCNYAGASYVQITNIIIGEKNSVISWRSTFGKIKKIRWFDKVFKYYFEHSETETSFRERLL